MKAQDAKDLFTHTSVFIRKSRNHLQLLIELIDKSLKEVESVLVLAKIDSVAPETEYLPELLWYVVLKLAFHKVTEDLLDLI